MYHITHSAGRRNRVCPRRARPLHGVEPLEPRRLLSAAPSRPDLIASSDTGVSDTDNITRFDNATPATALQFLVGNTTPGARVTAGFGPGAGVNPFARRRH
jgi:hypothetical protein